jgi:hypothetical protein
MSRDADTAPDSPQQYQAHHADLPSAPAATWRLLGRAAGYFACGAFLVQTVLYLLDGTGVLAPQMEYHVTGREVQQDLIDYYVNYNERMHSIWWDVALRDVLGTLGYLALMVLVWALLKTAGTQKPREELAQLFVVLGASAAALSDLMYLSHITWWRRGGFEATPDIIAYGRAFEIVDNVGNYVRWAGLLVLALGFACLRPTLAAALGKWHRLSLLAYVESLALLAFVVTNMAEADTAANVAAVASGLIFGPALAVLVARALVPWRSPQRHAV